MYYRQAGLFISYLKELESDSFKKSYIDLIEGKSFESVWETHYQKTLNELWNSFMDAKQT